MKAETMIQLKDVKFRYPGQKRDIVNIPSQEFFSGQAVAVVGPSGVGKTTFLKLLSGMVLPQSGDVIVKGQSLIDLSESARDTFRGRHISFVFQKDNLIPSLTAWENIYWPMVAIGGVPDRKKIDEAMDKAGLVGQADLYPHQLSGGQAQRVAVLRSFFHPGEIILADEPTSSLDPSLKSQMIDWMLDQHKQTDKTLIVVSHDESVISRFPSRIGVCL